MHSMFPSVYLLFVRSCRSKVSSKQISQERRDHASCPSLHRLPSHLWQVLRSVALVRLDNLSTGQLRISVTGVHNLLSSHNTQSLETFSSTELARPSAANGESTALDVLVSLASSWVASDFVSARRGARSVVGVDGEAVVARSAVLGADALEVLHGPGGALDHHGLANSCFWSWCCKGGGGSGQESDGGEELHIDWSRLFSWLRLLGLGL